MSQQPEAEKYPAYLECPCEKCGMENTLDSKFCKNCGHWLVGEWEKVHFEAVRIKTRFVGWQWIALAAAIGIIIGILIGVALGGGF